VSRGELDKMPYRTKTRKQPDGQAFLLPLYHIVLLDDEEHTYDYVVEMLIQIFGFNRTVAYQLAKAVDAAGRVVVDTTYKERAEFKCDQIRTFGPDPRIPRCRGSMTALIEPAAGHASS
jgi:ATP-dependent Clp protease adaptor protein ClpS